jgi:RimJ/RimL family protein N-acetyltransferase
MTDPVLIDAAGRRRSPATMPGFHRGRPPRDGRRPRGTHAPGKPRPALTVDLAQSRSRRACHDSFVLLDRQPTLAGPTVRVRPLRAEDFEPLYAVARDPLIWEQHPDPNRWRRNVFAQLFADGLASCGALVVLSRDGEVIGSSRFDRFDPERRKVEIGWTFLARSLWGGATNRELKGLMLDHAFEAVDIVVFRVGVDNRRSRRAVEKLGAVHVAIEPDPRFGDHAIYELRRADRQDIRERPERS